ncbi:unnamed protein product, partial [Meganyctiphanes norvegica]
MVQEFWHDDRLKWNPDDYGGLDKVYLADGEFWKPDITVLNNAEFSELDHYGNTDLSVFRYGEVWWNPPANIQVECLLDLTYWPYDTQTCGIDFGIDFDIYLYYPQDRTKLQLEYYQNIMKLLLFLNGCMSNSNCSRGGRYAFMFDMSLIQHNKNKNDVSALEVVKRLIVVFVMFSQFDQIFIYALKLNQLNISCHMGMLVLTGLSSTLQILTARMASINENFVDLALLRLFVLELRSIIVIVITPKPSLSPPISLNHLHIGTTVNNHSNYCHNH